jgi:FixJ family two-component response regulator
VDDDASHRVAVCRLLTALGLQAREFGSAAEFLAGVTPATSGCVVADLRMPGVDGLELQEALARTATWLPVVFLTGQGDIPSSVRAMRRGAVDFLEKRAPMGQLIEAVRRALERGAAAHSAHVRQDALRRRFASLTNRERDVLRHVVSGRMNKEIGAALGIRERTVKLYRTSLTRKLRVHSVAELTRLTREAGIFDPHS